ncbi:restriction endonuclease subunit S [Microbacterium xylanilyticum]
MTRLADVVDMTFGFAFKSSDFSERRGDIRLLRGDNIAQGRLRWDGVKRFPIARLAEVERYALECGDIVIAMDRPWIAAGLKYSVVRAADLPSLLVQRVARLRAKADLMDQGFLAAIIGSDSFTEYVIGVQTGSAVPHISGGQIGSYTFDLPSLEDQREIAAVLNAFDDKIESNHRAISLMEDLGSAILAERLASGTHGSPSYDSSRRLGALLEVLETGSRPRGGVAAGEDGTVSLGAENVQSAGVSATMRFKRIPDSFASEMKRGHLANEDVLVYKDGGKPGNFVPHVSAFGYGFPVECATINEHVYRVRSGGGVSQALLYWILRSSWMDHEMRKRGTGVAIPSLNSANFRDLPIPLRLDEEVAELNDRLTPLLAEMLRRGSETRRLVMARDAILPQLLSGTRSCGNLLEAAS